MTVEHKYFGEKNPPQDYAIAENRLNELKASILDIEKQTLKLRMLLDNPNTQWLKEQKIEAINKKQRLSLARIGMSQELNYLKVWTKKYRDNRAVNYLYLCSLLLNKLVEEDMEFDEEEMALIKEVGEFCKGITK